MPESDGDVTILLAQVREGNREAADRLIPLIYAELRRMAGAYMQREKPGHTLQPTALVHEAWLRMAGGANNDWRNRAHFFAIAAHTMRQVLLDYARRRHAEKRGGSGARKVDLDAEIFIAPEKLEDLLALDEALEQLAQFDPQQSRLIELRFFAGLSVEEVAEVLGIPPAAVNNEWRSAKAWLHKQMATWKSS